MSEKETIEKTSTRFNVLSPVDAKLHLIDATIDRLDEITGHNKPMPLQVAPYDRFREGFQKLLAEYVTVLAEINGNAAASVEWCQLCSRLGTSIFHRNQVCKCICHRARKLLAEYDEFNGGTVG